ncbi:MAG: helix-turn-helix transcriptional regulator [Paludibacter sp.]|nr:helix-turn-helix transcriptional regulator [Paludibacter sp.]
MKRNSIMEESRKLITPEIKQSVDFSIDIANRIFDILEMKGMKQKDLAKLLEKSEAEISKWLKGTHNFNIDTILKIQVKLGEEIIQVVGKAKKEVDIINWTERNLVILSKKTSYTGNLKTVEYAA